MKLSIIIPVFNEQETMQEILTRVKQAPALGYQKEIIVVDDGSRDRTGQILTALQKRFNFILLQHQHNQGKGAAIQTALANAHGELVLIQDADLEYNPKDYVGLLSAFREKQTVIYGSRNLKPKRQGYVLYVAGVALLTRVVNLLFHTALTDIYTGYKLFPTRLLKTLAIQSRGFAFEAEVTVKILKRGIAIHEIPIDYAPRKFSAGKKIRFLDGAKGLCTILRYYFSHSLTMLK